MHPDEMVSRYESVLYARAMRLLRTRSDALDLVQDTYERALRGKASFTPGTNLRHWLMTIMYNLFLDRCRRLSREPRSLPTMRINPAVKNIFGFKFEDFTLEGYDPYPAIKAPVAV